MFRGHPARPGPGRRLRLREGISIDTPARSLAILLTLALLGPTAAAWAGRPGPSKIPVDDTFEVIPVRGKRPAYRRAYTKAGRLLGRWTIDFAGVGIDGRDLVRMARTAPGESFTRVLREGLRRPVDPHDFLLLLDDLLVAGRKGLYGRRVFILPGRARSIGAMLHPQDVFEKAKRRRGPRQYPYKKDELQIDRPRRRPEMPAAEDGDLLGPGWVMRYKNPLSREAKLRALAKINPSGTFAARIRSLINQLEEQGAQVGLYTTVRSKHRGYLMWGAFALSRKKTRGQVIRFVRDLERLNHEWGLDIAIRWYHPGGWRATVETARLMCDAYDVVYATKTGAHKSNHYDGEAVDFTAVGLPRKLTLTAPSGLEKTFDLGEGDHPRDLNLAPELIKWVERRFHMKKLDMDYPHWNDAAAPDATRRAMAAAEAEKPQPPPAAPAPIELPQPEPPAPLADTWFDLAFPGAPIGTGALGLVLVGFGLRRRRR